MTTDELLEELRPRGFAVAYRMLGSVSEAEDVVQEALLRLVGELRSGTRIDSPEAYLVTVVTRLAIDVLRSARVRREQYVGEWLPEPLVTSESADDPAAHAELADSLSFAFLALLERLTPEQRAVFLLRDVFDYPFEQIAEIVGKSEPAVRQSVVRARRHVDDGRPRYEASAEQRERLAGEFFRAVEDGDLGGLEQLLAGDVVLRGDGGGKAPALARALEGRSRVARTLVAWSHAGRRIGGISIRRVEVNGQPGAMMVDANGKLINVMALAIEQGEITAVSSLVNPDKLRHLGPVADLTALMRRA